MASPTLASPSGDFHKLPAARAFLLEHLADGSWQPRAEVFAAAQDLGYRPATVRRALNQLVDHDGAVEQRRRNRVSQLRSTGQDQRLNVGHVSGNRKEEENYPKRDTVEPTILPPRGALAFGHTRQRFLDPSDWAPLWCYLLDGLWAADHRLPQRRKEALCERITDVVRLASGKDKHIPRRCHSHACDVCAVLANGPAPRAIREATDDQFRYVRARDGDEDGTWELVTPARTHLYYTEVTLPTQPADRHRFTVALRQAEKRARDAAAKAGDTWGGLHAFLGVRDGTGPWHTTTVCLLVTGPVRIPAGVATRGWERLPRADALAVLADEVLLVGAISAKVSLRGGWRQPAYQPPDTVVRTIGSARTELSHQVYETAEQEVCAQAIAEDGPYGPEWFTEVAYDEAISARFPAVHAQLVDELIDQVQDIAAEAAMHAAYTARQRAAGWTNEQIRTGWRDIMATFYPTGAILHPDGEVRSNPAEPAAASPA